MDGLVESNDFSVRGIPQWEHFMIDQKLSQQNRNQLVIVSQSKSIVIVSDQNIYQYRTTKKRIKELKAKCI
jgi:Flp pilus assembly CpaE family ATPase